MVGARARVLSFIGKLGNSPDDRASCARLSSRRIVSLSAQALSRKVVYLQGKVAAAYRRVTSDYAQVSVPVSVRQLLRGLEPATSSRATIRYDPLQCVLVCPVI